MKVWMLDPAQLTPYYNIALCDALALAGCEVQYITSPYLYTNDLPVSDNFVTDYHYFHALGYRWLTRSPRLRRGLRGFSYPLDHWRLWHKIRATPPDILHIQWSRLPYFDHRLIKSIRSLGIPIVHTVHDIIPLYDPHSNVEPLQQIYEMVDAIIVHAGANRHDFQRIYPRVNENRIHIVPFIRSPYRVSLPNVTREQIRREMDLPYDVPIFLFFGSIRHYKGLDILLSAFEKALQSEPDIHLVVAGMPETTEDVTLLRTALALPNVHVTGGYIPYAEMWKYYLVADVVILPYRAITQSAALMTAMEFGRAIIVTKVGALPESIEGNGWVVEPEDPMSLYNVMVEAARNTNTLQQMGIQSASLIKEKYDGAVVAEKTMELYRSIKKR